MNQGEEIFEIALGFGCESSRNTSQDDNLHLSGNNESQPAKSGPSRAIADFTGY